MILTDRVMQLIDSTLRGDATQMTRLPGGLYQTMLPAIADPSQVYGIYAQQTPLQDIQGRAGQTVMGRGMVTVQAIGPTEQAAAIALAADRMDALLNTLLGSAGGATVIRIVRNHELLYDELVKDTGVLYTHAGYVFEWWAQ
jgi:hypothetical protein